MNLIVFVLGLISITISPSTAADKLRIGVLQSTSGIAAEDGKTVVQALQLASERLGDKVELVVEDDQTSPKNVVSAYNTLRTKGVDAIVGATWDFTTNTLIPLAARDKVVLFNTSTLPESLSMHQSDGFVFTSSVSALEEAAPYSRFIRSKAMRSMITVYANNAWGETQRKIYQKIAQDAGLHNLGDYSSVAFDQNEWRTVVPAMKAKNPDFVLLLLNKNDLDIFLKRAQELAFKPAFFASKNAYDALAASDQKSLYNGLCLTYPLEQLQRNGEFSRDYRKRFGEDPRIYADSSYDALFILARGHEISREKRIPLQEALKQVSLDGLAGRYRYSNRNSFSIGTSSLLCVEKGVAGLKN